MKGVIPTSLPTTGQDVISPFSVLGALVIGILQIVKLSCYSWILRKFTENVLHVEVCF